MASAGRLRVYVPASRHALVQLLAGEPWAAPHAFAVTAALRAAADGGDDEPDADDEQLEFEAFLLAAGASLGALPQDENQRVVVCADVPLAAVAPGGGSDGAGDEVPGTVRLTVPVQPHDVAAVHVDDADGAAVVARVRAGASPAVLDDVALLWFAPGEVDQALALLGAPDGA